MQERKIEERNKAKADATLDESKQAATLTIQVKTLQNDSNLEEGKAHEESKKPDTAIKINY